MQITRDPLTEANAALADLRAGRFDASRRRVRVRDLGGRIRRVQLPFI